MSQGKLGMYTQYTEYNFSVNEAGVTGSGSPAFHGLCLSLVGVLTPSPQRASSQRSSTEVRQDLFEVQKGQAQFLFFLFN